jgi:peptidyl-prolyl cis-trans isomerase SurA
VNHQITVRDNISRFFWLTNQKDFNTHTQHLNLLMKIFSFKHPSTIRIITIALLSCFVFVMGSQETLAKKKDNWLVKIGGVVVSESEFLANYRKNNTNIQDEKDRKSPEEYLQLFTNFKLKVLEAQKLGYDTLKTFVEELKGYRQELAKPYLTDVSFNQEMVQTAYRRTQYERKASHILIRTNPDSAPADTLTVWNKISDIRAQIMSGADFNEIATKFSEDPSAVQNNGLLGYFSAFQMVYPFEDMTYKTPVGQVSQIIRTRFGYHLIKVHDERLSRGDIKVAHIMKMFPQQASDETIARLKLSADSIWKLAQEGVDFAELAKKHSDDKQSAAEGGTMSWFSSTNMVPSFAEAAFALKNDGDISPVIRTPFGWHIIKRLELRTTPPFEKLKVDLEAKIKQNPAISKYSDEAFNRRLRAEYQLKVDDQVFLQYASSLSDSLKTEQMGSLKLVYFANQCITVSQFAAFLKTQNFEPDKLDHEAKLKEQLNSLISRKLIEYEDTQLEKKHSDFARIYQEYHDGILLFNISKDKIWDMATNDTIRLQKYFEQTSKKYYWNDRFKGWIIDVKNQDMRDKIEKLLDEKDYSQTELEDVFNTKTENNIQIKPVAVEKGNDPIVDYYIWNGPKPAGFNETTTFVHGKIVSNELKDLKDAWGIYSSDLQEVVEKEWVDSLRKKYPIEINFKLLRKMPMSE